MSNDLWLGEEEREFKFDKSLAVLYYIFDCSVNYARAYRQGDYRSASDYLILWSNALYPLAYGKADKINKKMKDYLKLEGDDTVVKKLETAISRLDSARDKNNLSFQASRQSFNNFLINHERFLRVLEYELGVYQATKPTAAEAIFSE